MNKTRYRIVFNKARGCLMAVAETAMAHGQGASGATTCGAARPGQLRLSVLGLVCKWLTGTALVCLPLAWLAPLQAQTVVTRIVADPAAPSAQRPTVLTTSNGVVQVDIRTPSAAGVSRNTYSQFDVGAAGAVLNNSRTPVQTQQGGWVQGNPWLATGSARVILNEVNSNNPSYLQGYVEVAGQRAQVIIANPSGIAINGGGFINAGTATLTTGTPQINGGSLEAYRVQRGTIRIDGAGLDAKLTDYTGILARAIVINAKVHANNLQVLAGDNTVNADQDQVQASATPAAGSAPAFALDVSQLGGMYAGKITLIGTEAGLGVRHHGTLSASAGDVHIDVKGWLSSAGAIEAKQGHVVIQTAQRQDISGSVTAAGNLTLHAGTDTDRQFINNSGKVRAGLEANVRASQLDNSGDINAQRLDVAVAGLSNSGDIWQSGAQALQVQAQTLRNASGAAVGAVQAPATAPAPSPSPSPTPEPAPAPAPSPAPAPASAPTPAPAHAPLATGVVSVAGELLNQNAATLAAPGELQVSTSRALYNAGHIRAASVQARGDTLAVSGGTLQADTLSVNTKDVQLSGGAVVAGQATLDATRYTQAQGAQLYSQGDLALRAGSLSNAGDMRSGAQTTVAVARAMTNSGTLAAAGDLGISAGSVDSSGTLAAGLNANGKLKAFAADGAALSVTTTGDLTATGAHLAAGAMTLGGEAVNLSGSDTSVHSANITARGALTTDRARLITSANTTIGAKSLSNTAGTVYAGGTATVKVEQALSNTSTVAVAGSPAVAATLAAAGNLTVTAGSVNSSGTLAAGLNADGNLKTFAANGAALSVTTTGNLTATGTGTNLAAGAMTLAGQAVNLSGSETSAYTATVGSAAALNTSSAEIMTQGDLTMTATGALNNTEGKLTSAQGHMGITARGVNNTDGLMVAARQLTVGAGNADITNNRGQLLAQGDVSLSTGTALTNTGGLIQSNAAVHLTADTVNNSQTSTTTQGIVGQDIQIGVATLNNQQGQVLADRDLTITASGSILNTQGKLNAQRSLMLQDSPVGAPTAVASRQLAITNTGGQIVANSASVPAASSVSVRAKTLGLDGTLSSGGDMALDLVGDLSTKADQQLRAGRDLSVRLNGGTLNNAGQWQAGRDLSVRADHINNQVSGELLSQGITTLDTTQNASGTLLNRGVVDGADTRVRTHTLDNTGTGRIYGDRVAVAAHTLVNRKETVGGVTKAGTIAARERLDIGAQHITNKEGSLIFSAGDLAIVGALDAKHRAITDGSANAQTLNNNSATIESLGNMALAANTLRNTNERLVVSDVSTGPAQRIVEYQGHGVGSGARYLAGTPGVRVGWETMPTSGSYLYILHTPEAGGYGGGFENPWTAYDYNRSITVTSVLESSPAQIVSGGNLDITSSSVLNDSSYIMAGGALSVPQGSLSNTTITGQKVVTDAGTATSYWRHKQSGDDVTHSSSSAINSTTTQTIQISLGRVEQNTAPTGSGTQLATKATTGALGTAGAGNGQTTSNALKSQTAATSGMAAGQAGISASGGGSAANSANARQDATAGLGQQAAPGPVLPGSSLFTIHPDPSARFVVVTDARFTNYRQWLSSDYMFSALAIDPATTQKRLGDGFYEQKLIRDQVAALTGYRFLGDYRSDDEQYKALMNAGVSFGQAHQLRPGVALSPAQVAQLTSDMVWLVAQTVTLPDGSTTTALVPQVYLSPKAGDLASNGHLFGGGAVISANEVRMALSGDVKNSGTLMGRKLIDISAQNINNSGLIQGAAALLSARNDINITGGQVRGTSAAVATAGGDLNVTTTTQSSSKQVGANSFSQTGIDRVAGIYVSGPAGVLLASAGGDINLTAAQLRNAGSGVTSLSAGGNVNLGTVEVGSSSSIVWNNGNSVRQSSSTEVGAQVRGGGAVNISATQDLNLRAADVNAQGALKVDAGGNVLIEAGQSSNSLDESFRFTGKGFLSKQTTTMLRDQDSTTSVASNLEGQSVSISAGQDLGVKGTNVLADQDVRLKAGGNVKIEAAQNTQSSSSFNETKKSGLFSSGGLSFTIGKQQQSLDSQGQSTTAAQSTIGAINGNVTIKAGGAYTQTGSDVLTPKGDIAITAKKVDITEARETGSQSSEQKFKQSGLTVAITSPVISALQTAGSQLQAAGNTSSGRMQALAGANAAFNLKQGADAIKAGQGDANGMVKDAKGNLVEGNAADKAGGIGISISVGSSSSQSKQNSSADNARGSSINAGGNVTIQATRTAGAPNDTDKDSNLTVQGSSIQAAGTTTLKADNQVNLLAAANTTSESSTNQSKSGSVGVAMQLGNGGGGMGVTASASKATGQGAGNGVSYTNTQVAGNTVNIESGGDTTLKGAVVKANQVTTDVGGNLSIQSLQDTNQYKESSKSAGGSIMVGAGVSGSVNLAKSSINSNYQSVGEQSAIRAGDGGFQVEVKGDTTLTGAQITSTQAAIDKNKDNNKNRFQTGGTLTTSDLQNKASYEAKSVSVGLGAGALPGKSASAGMSGVGFGSDKESASSTTTAGISGVAGNTTARTGDASTSIAPIFDADKVKKEIEAQVTITQEFGKQAGKAITAYTNGQRKALQEQAKNASTPEDKAKAEQAIKDVNMQERALNILTGALTGMVGSVITKEALSTAAEKMRDLMIEDSKKFAGVVDSTGKPLFSNQSGESAGVNGTGFKLGGTRADLDLLCGTDGNRCSFEKNPDGSIDKSKPVTFLGQENADKSRQSYAEFLKTEEGQKMLSAPFGGLQGGERTLFGQTYEKGSWQDKLIEAFAGPHDLIGGKLSGLYDAQGNIKKGMSSNEIKAYDRWSAAALLPAAPFAASQVLSPEIWKAIGILLKAGQ
jgi:filamentous hemagglutinin